MKLLFQNSQGKERIVAEVDSFKEACEEMDKFMETYSPSKLNQEDTENLNQPKVK